MTLKTLYKKYLKLMAKNDNPYSFLELLTSEGLIPGFVANPISLPNLIKTNQLKLPSFNVLSYNFFDLLIDTGAMVKPPKKANISTQEILREMARMLSGAANDNKGGPSFSSGSKVA